MRHDPITKPSDGYIAAAIPTLAFLIVLLAMLALPPSFLPYLFVGMIAVVAAGFIVLIR